MPGRLATRRARTGHHGKLSPQLLPEGPAHGSAIGNGELPFSAGGDLVGERPERKWPCRHVALLLGQRRQDLRALSIRWRVSTDEDEERCRHVEVKLHGTVVRTWGERRASLQQLVPALELFDEPVC